MGAYCGDSDRKPQGTRLAPGSTQGLQGHKAQVWILLSRDPASQPLTHQPMLTEHRYCATLCYSRGLSRRKKRPVPQGAHFLGKAT